MSISELSGTEALLGNTIMRDDSSSNPVSDKDKDKDPNVAEDVLNSRVGRPLPKQFERMIEILELYQYPVLKQKDRQVVWDTITSELNSFGLQKSTQKWRKTFADWKHSLKKKITENKELNTLEKRAVQLFMNQKRRSNDSLVEGFHSERTNDILNEDDLNKIKDEPLDFLDDCEDNVGNVASGTSMDSEENKSDYISQNNHYLSNGPTLNFLDDCDTDLISEGTQMVECKPEINLYNSLVPSPATYSSSSSTSEDLFPHDPSFSKQSPFFSRTRTNQTYEINNSVKEYNKIASHINELNQRLPNSNITTITTSTTRTLPRVTSSRFNSATMETIDPPPLVSITNPNKKFKPDSPERAKTNELNLKILEKLTRMENHFSSMDQSLIKIASAIEKLVPK